MWRILFSLALFAPTLVHADMVDFYQVHAVTTTPSGSGHIELSDSFTLPQFDPSLGMLNSILFDVELGGQLTWNQFYMPDIASLDFEVNTTVSALGLTVTHNEAPVYGNAGLGICNWGNWTQPCVPAHSNISDDGGVALYGSLGDGSSTVTDLNFYRGLNGALPTSLDAYTGLSTFTLPVSFSIDARSLSYNLIGDLTGPQNLVTYVGWEYDYTPTPVIETVSAAPEPGTFGLCAATLITLGALRIQRVVVFKS
jgi:hypothetical protein